MIKINDTFHTAGLKYGWKEKPEGVGIAKHFFEGSGFIELEIKGVPYRVEKSKAREFVNGHRSYFVAKGVPLGVIPTQILEKIDNNLKLL